MTDTHYKSCFKANFQGLFLYSFTIVKDSAEAKDIVQRSFIKLWENCKAVDEAAAKTFLYTTTYRLSLNSIRDQKNRSRHHMHLLDNSRADTGFKNEEKELKERLQSAIQTLPPRCREVFVKVRLEGMKYREVAEQMGISERTVETQLVRAFKHIKHRIHVLIILVALALYQALNLLS